MFKESNSGEYCYHGPDYLVYATDLKRTRYMRSHNESHIKLVLILQLTWQAAFILQLTEQAVTANLLTMPESFQRLMRRIIVYL